MDPNKKKKGKKKKNTEAYRKIFAKFDQDESGQIDLDEVSDGLEILECRITREFGRLPVFNDIL